nr:hypothetical protein [Micromonospora sp. DSM 115978]
MAARTTWPVTFDLDGDVPFLWNPADPVTSLRLNALSVVVVAAEGLVTCAVRDAPLTWTGPLAEESAATPAQVVEQRAAAHRQHVDALVRRWPGLRGAADDATRTFDKVAASHSQRYRIAYVADLST